MTAARAVLVDVSDTARWMAYLRALESERPDALFRDPYARRLAGERGRQIAEAMPDAPGAKPGAAGFSSLLAVRTRVFDELILQSVRATNADAVLNLAAGLDARPYRLSLPPSLVWVEADRATLLESKAAALRDETPSCKVERAAVELADASARGQLLERVLSEHARVVVITEGLLVYLDEAVVRSLAAELRARPAVKRWVLEAATPEVLKRNMGAWGPILRRGNAEWKFARPEGFDFYDELGWSSVERRSFFEEARRLGRSPRHALVLGWLCAASSTFRNRMRNMVTYGVVEPS
jgi:methyltransferase (TIGR00027 family)